MEPQNTSVEVSKDSFHEWESRLSTYQERYSTRARLCYHISRINNKDHVTPIDLIQSTLHMLACVSYIWSCIKSQV